MITEIKKAILKSFQLAGWELRKVQQASFASPPPVYDDPWEVIWRMREGQPAAYNCPLDVTVRPFGQSFASSGWEPLTETAKQYVEGDCISYEESILAKYHEAFRPANASEAIIGFCGTSLQGYPPFAALCAPWTPMDIRKLIEGVRRSLAEENAEHGEPCLSVDHGTKYYGPVLPRKGQLEFRRITTLVHSIQNSGYLRSHGDVDVTVLCRENEYRYLKIGPGYHRTAVLAALGFKTVPATFRYPYVIDVSSAAYWPQVKRGEWKLQDAIRYFNHLFDFDSRAWASDRGLLIKSAQ